MEQKKQIGRKKLSPVELKQRQDFLSNELPTMRTKRVLNPRIKKVLKGLDSLVACAGSSRYVFTPEQIEQLLGAIASRYEQLETSLNGSTKQEIKDIL